MLSERSLFTEQNVRFRSNGKNVTANAETYTGELHPRSDISRQGRSFLGKDISFCCMYVGEVEEGHEHAFITCPVVSKLWALLPFDAPALDVIV